MSWDDRAACKGTPTDMWFPSKGTAAATSYAAGKWYCERCPVRAECLDEAMRVESPAHRYGMRAGLMPNERDAIARGDTPYPEFPPPLPMPEIVHRSEGATAVSVTDITPPQPPKLGPADLLPDTLEALIEWGARHQSSRIQSLAGKASAALADLRQAAEREIKAAEAEARVKRLEAQLAEAKQDLRAARGGTSTPAHKHGATTSRPNREELAAIRAWARQHGYKVAPAGVIARAVVEAYYAAQKPAPLPKAG